MISLIQRLRIHMAKHALAWVVIPHSDEYQNEYLPPHHERLSALSGFTGSFGAAVVGQDSAFLFTDGRYTVQVQSELDLNIWQPVNWAAQTPWKWLAGNLQQGQKVGIYPWVHTVRELRHYEQAVERGGGALVMLPRHPVDAIWDNRPKPLKTHIISHPAEFSGRSSEQKITQIAAKLKDDRIDAVVLNRPDSICWLLNIRGREVPYNPVALSYLILHADGHVDWFVDPAKVNEKLLKQLPHITAHVEADLSAGLESLKNKTIGIDEAAVPAAVERILQQTGAKVRPYADPCLLPKACKNEVETEGMRNAHQRDGVALCRFLAWVDAESPKETLTEIAAADKLATLRAENNLFEGLSFATIAAVGPNGAIVHYHPTVSSNRPLKNGDIFLVDSGAQYLDATTDVTRTVRIGDAPPPEELKAHYTRVLKGHIALSALKFPKGTSGSQIDVIARQFLWQSELDYDHGTGHGVGSYLNVHEGPARISKRNGDEPLQPGMILSNEPGYYLEGQYGIRLENLVMVQPAAKEGWLQFETLTLAPFDPALIDTGLLSPDEKEWINAYHQRVREQVGPHLSGDEKNWLERVTAALR